MKVIGVIRDPGERSALEEAGAEVVDRIDARRLIELLS
jgi:hypothetical protein